MLMPHIRFFASGISVKSRAVITAFVVAGLVLLLAKILIDFQEFKHRADEISITADYGDLLRTSVDRELNSLLFISNGMASYISAYHRELDPAKVRSILKDLWTRSKHVRNLGVAVGYKVTYVYPEQTNRRIIGVDFRDLPAQWPQVKQAIDTQSGVLDGPIALIQGGNGIVYRYPVFIDGDYWGIISTVIDTPAFLKAAFEKTHDSKFRFGIRTGNNKKVFYGNPDFFGDPKAFMMTSAVPNGHWEWAIVKSTHDYLDQILLLQGIGLMVSLLFGYISYSMVMNHYRLKEFALVDSVTKLPNRRLLTDRIGMALAENRRFQMKVGLLLVDIDHFKQINDNHGHDYGDEALKIVSSALQSLIRESDTVGRLGGDEFLVILPKLAGAEDLTAVAEKIKQAFQQPFIVLGKEMTIHLSMGGTLHSEPDTSIDELLKEADIALYQTKVEGRNGYRLYDKNSG